MKQFEYLTRHTSDYMEDTDLCELGLDGWELCGICRGRMRMTIAYTFKRELEPSDKAS